MNVRSALALALVACSSAPSPERSAHPDTAGDSATRDATPAATAPVEPSAEHVPDVTAAAIEALRTRLACNREGPPSIGSAQLACGALGHFANGRAPELPHGVLPGVVVEPGTDGRDFARPALLAIRGAGASAEVAWGRILPHDPRDAADLAAMAADVLLGHAPTFVPAPWPGLTWSRVQPTDGPSVQIATGPRILVRESDGFTAVLVLDEEAPVFALHRAPAR